MELNKPPKFKVYISLNIEEMEMRLLLSIGEFSKICEVSTKTLRYYDEIGLIHPDEINPVNGYRYYSIKQLTKMLFINRLKSYHFSLEEIKDILEWEQDHFEEKLSTALNLKKENYKRNYELTNIR